MKIGYFIIFIIVFSALADVYADDSPFKKNQKCQEYESSYSNYVLKARQLANHSYHDKAASLFKKHLDCWNDPEVSTELAALYSSQKKYYLAGVVLKEAGLIDLYNETENLRIAQNSEERISQIKFSAQEKASGFEKSYRKNKDTAIPLIILGTTAFGTGLGLFMHEKAFSGTNSKTAQYTLMFSGFSMIGSGIILNLAAQTNKNYYLAYSDLSKRNFDLNSVLDDDFIIPSIENSARSGNIRDLKNHGISLIVLSIPMIALAGFAIYETTDYVWNSDSLFQFRSESGAFLYGLFRLFYMPTIAGAFALLPSIFFIVSGIKDLVKSSRLEKMNTDSGTLTLNSVTPIINPVSKTYGLSMGFSF